MAGCCNSCHGRCRQCMEPTFSFLRCIENIPIIGHGVAAVYGCCGSKSKAERAAIKATVGIIMAPLNFPAELIDEIGRNRSKKLVSYVLKQRTDWMKDYQRRSLAQICLPATHQSATFVIHKKLSAIPLVEGWSGCQNQSIEGQLLGGIRFLDLRVMTYKKDVEIWLHHNVVICLKLKDVLATVRDFVQEFPTEIVGLYITNDGKEVDWGKVHAYLQEYLGHTMIHEHMKNMAIGDIVGQGKNVAIFGVPGVAYSWSCLEYRWPNKAWPNDLAQHMKDTINEQSGANSNSYFWYKAECTPSTSMVVRSIGGLPGLVIGKCADEKFEFIKGMGGAVNTSVYEILQDLNHLPFNVLSADFIADEIIERILELNQTADNMGVAPLMMDESGQISPMVANEDEEVDENDGLVQPVSPHVLTTAPRPNQEVRESGL